MQKIEISKENVEQAYKTADDNNVKNVLRALFGNAVDEEKPKLITDRIKTYEDACTELGEEPINEKVMLAAGFTEDEITYRKLKTITKALNEGWYPDWSDEDEYKWVPWFGASSGFAFYDTNYYYSNALAGYASRLCFKTDALAEYAGREFNDLYKAFIQ